MNRKITNVKTLIAVILMLGVFSVSCNSNKNKKKIVKNGFPIVQFDTTYYDFGTLVQGEKASHTFKLRNVGTADLVILDAYSTCGCTVPNFSKDPVKPGDYGKIDVVFDSTGKMGLQYKTVIIKLNTRISEKSIMIKVNVTQKK